MMKLRLAAGAALVAAVAGLDVEIKSVACDPSLPVTADIKMKCGNGSTRCSFGEEIEMYGTMYQNGTSESGIDLETMYAYTSAEINLLAIDFTLFDMMAIPLCGAYVTANESNANECPYDGAYDFAVTYNLPRSGADASSWLASGWAGQAVISMYAEPDESNMLIGQCVLELKTYSTPNAEYGLVQAPSAAETAGIVLGVLGAVMLCCIWCYCCQKKRKLDNLDKGDDLTSQFRRMTDAEDDVPKSIGKPVEAIDAKSQVTAATHTDASKGDMA